jgi:hypothetical protein
MNRATRTFHLLAATILFVAQAAVAQVAPGKACGLITDSEAQSILAAKVTLKDGSLGSAQTCTAESQAATMMLRLFKRAGDPSGATEKAGIEAVKKMGAQVDVKTSGGITCITTVPPANLAQYGYGTTCTVTSKAPLFAVIEVTSKTQKDMVPMEKLRTIAEKMATRF